MNGWIAEFKKSICSFMQHYLMQPYYHVDKLVQKIKINCKCHAFYKPNILFFVLRELDEQQPNIKKDWESSHIW